MFGRALIKSIAPVVSRSSIVTPQMVRFFAADATPAGKTKVTIPDLVDTLEWVLDSPPNVHQFDEPPIIVEIEHLKALKFEEPELD
mmetsp:Transcript_10528/g.17162  ORF Transcript_10528/g.17162 Transcript_10528/m.17162 type:complete len:86 (-) Transcript_10528:186-443(-)|eukprot:CAMPEP_0174989800 /NCGR_PEP_ID=MMETSP0004_2-20121128/20936_1 /TAXON_ID=420556 /ORGANISM="Ochromonas sp., Strain CCMP1393" /LENGTH=85 /DNA_ID=CAMNT_0016243275 /DNA_START=66 /DNA_END=323 /DNA_ORIENTATION=+